MQDGQEAGSGSSGMDVMVKRNKSHNMQTNILANVPSAMLFYSFTG